MFVLGHLGLTLLGGRLLRPIAWTQRRFPVGLLLLGALLPDLIDKPLGHWILPWDNGRIFAHTLAFTLLLLALAWARASPRVGAIGMGVGLHQVLDQLPWTDAASWLWPLAGGFPRGVSPGAPDWIAALLSDPYVWATEALGLLSLAALLVLPLLGVGSRWWQPQRREGSPKAPLGPLEGPAEASEDVA